MSVHIRPLNPVFSAELTGIDLRQPMAAHEIAAIIAALDQSAVAVLPGQGLDDEQQITFSARLGTLALALNPGRKVGQGARLRPELFDISNLDETGSVLDEADRRRQWREGDRLWHTDRSFIDADTTYSLLSARVIPPLGGETEFADMRAAYDALDGSMKRRIEGLRAEHSVWYSRALAGGRDFRDDEIAAMPPVPQPLVRVHPGSGRKSLVLASHASHIIGWKTEEGRALLAELMEFATEPRFVYVHKWRVGDLVIWDNRCTMHRGTRYDDVKYRRDMRRTTVEGRPSVNLAVMA
jgi:alpha-ketoglutarate-dependent 2,4-dichlorophenoxyacetate dioxygenase